MVKGIGILTGVNVKDWLAFTIVLTVSLPSAVTTKGEDQALVPCDNKAVPVLTPKNFQRSRLFIFINSP